MKRKHFIQSSGAALLGSLLLRKGSFDMFAPKPKDIEMGLQLFTFFNEIDNDVEGTLKKIAGVGYKKIESAFSKKGGYYGMKPKEFAKFLKDIGMSWKSHHVLGAPFKMPPGAKMPTGADGKPITIPPMKSLKDSMQELVDEAAEGGVDYLVCANTPISTLDDIKSSIEVLNKTDEACKKQKLVLLITIMMRSFVQWKDKSLTNCFYPKRKCRWSLTLHGLPRAVKIRLNYLSKTQVVFLYGM